MSIEQPSIIDIATVDHASGDLWLTVSDHLPWDNDETGHLQLLHDKINSYLRFIESGEVAREIPEVEGRRFVINLVGKFPLTAHAQPFIEKAQAAVRAAGYELQFSLRCP